MIINSIKDIKRFLYKTAPKCKYCGKLYPGIDGYCNICRLILTTEIEISVKIPRRLLEETE